MNRAISFARRLLRGAKEIARFIYGSETEWRSIATLQRELPIFRLGGRVVAYRDALDSAMKAKEKAARAAISTSNDKAA